MDGCRVRKGRDAKKMRVPNNFITGLWQPPPLDFVNIKEMRKSEMEKRKR
jgi:hypothetical protein